MRWIIIFLILKIQYECLSIYNILNVDIGIIYNVVLIFDIFMNIALGCGDSTLTSANKLILTNYRINFYWYS